MRPISAFSRIRSAPALYTAPLRISPARHASARELINLSHRKMSNLTINSKVKLNSGYEMPLLGYGVYEIPVDEAERCVTEALEAGYRHVDSAAAYRNEAPCGRAIRKFVETSGVPRGDIFFTSKVRAKGMSYDTARAQVDTTLSETGLDYIDLMLLHAPYGGSANRKGAWRALVEAAEQGKVRSIGVSNYGTHHLDELERHMGELAAERGGAGSGSGGGGGGGGGDGGGILSVGQWEVHPWLPRPDIVAWARGRGVAVQAYCPLVRGQRWGEAALREVVASVAAERKDHDTNNNNDHKSGEPGNTTMAVTAAQVLLRWSLQKGLVPLPKSATSTRIRENADLYGFELGEDDMARLETSEYAPCTWDPTTSDLDN